MSFMLASFNTPQHKRTLLSRGLYGGLLALFLCATTALSAEKTDDNWLDIAKSKVESSRQLLDSVDTTNPDIKQLTDIKRDILPLRARVQSCIAEVDQTLQKRQKDLDLLGSQFSTEEPEVAQARIDIASERNSLEKRLAACNYILIQTKDIKERIDATEKASMAQQMLSKGVNSRQLLLENFQQLGNWWEIGHKFLIEQSGLQLLSSSDIFSLLGILLFSLWAGRVWRRVLLAKVQNYCVDRCTNFLLALRTCMTNALPILLPSVLMMLYLSVSLPLNPVPFIVQAALGVVFYVLAGVMISAAFNPTSPAIHYLPMKATLALALDRRLKVLLAVVLIGYFLFGTVFAATLSESQNFFTRSVYGLFLVVNLVWVVLLAGWLPGMVKTKGVRSLLVIALLFSLGAEWTGYRNLATFLITGLIGSVAGFGIVWFVNTLLKDMFDGLDKGFQPWQQQFRTYMELKENERLPGLIWIRLTSAVVLWGGLALLVLWIWGLSRRGFESIASLLQEGFMIGTFHFVPGQIVLAIIIFSVLCSVTGWLKRTGMPRWLKNTQLDQGARDALVTISGYVGLTISVIIGLSLAGLHLANIAIIAGALSVGIGFGLQNIVNNFVSGLVLHVERPIRVGDWIVVGTTEGYVRKINTRSTRIETFDHADVIVPNSELISGQVTNWMLHDSWGRIIVPIGVAYGTNTAKVRDALISVASKHEMVVTDSPRFPPPTVLIRGFGDNAIDFELRCFIKKIDKRYDVMSDLYFAIDEIFSREGIVIPFPQRDLHIKSWPSAKIESELPHA